MQRNRTITIICLVLGIVLAACTAPYKGSRTDAGETYSDQNLVYGSLALVSEIPCENLFATELPSGRLRITAQFFNDQDHTAECQIRVKFKDGTGRILEETPWMPLLLPRRESTQFEQNSMGTGATHYTVMLREAE